MKTNITDRHTFILFFQEEYKENVESVTEKYDEELDFWSYQVQLKEGIDKNDFLHANFQTIVDHTDFDDAFDMWFNQSGDDMETEASILSVNAEYNEGDEFEESEDEEANTLNSPDKNVSSE